MASKMVTSPVVTTAIWVLLVLVLAADYAVEARRQGINILEVAKVTEALGLKLHNPAAERAFFARDFRKVKLPDFRALQARAEEAKRQEKRLMAKRASAHAMVCNKLIKVGTEAIIGAIKHDRQFLMEHLIKFNNNVGFLHGRSCKDENF